MKANQAAPARQCATPLTIALANASVAKTKPRWHHGVVGNLDRRQPKRRSGVEQYRSRCERNHVTVGDGEVEHLQVQVAGWGHELKIINIALSGGV